MYVVYSLLTLVLFVVVSPYFVYQAIRYKKYIGSLRQRLGYLPISFNVDGEESIWIHAVSVGEREPGVASVSAPVWDLGRVAAAVAVSGPIDLMGRTPGAEYAKPVQPGGATRPAARGDPARA